MTDEKKTYSKIVFEFAKNVVYCGKYDDHKKRKYLTLILNNKTINESICVLLQNRLNLKI
jgi:hypothetical protein